MSEQDYKESNINIISLEEEMQRSYIDYAMSVIVSRALPDVRDGLKPVHRRILYSMYESGYYYNKQYRKSARVVGDVIGKYHPHGELAVYDSLVRMAQDFSLRLPLVDGQGNFGSMDGDAAAASRYTEVRLKKATHSLLEDINKDTVDFQSNYDGLEQEPKVLPAGFPNLLVNGTGGIAVGMATNIPPHNLSEVVDACCAYIDNNDITIIELIELVKGPDFPTGGQIIGTLGIKSAYNTGRGKIVVRGKIDIEDDSLKQAIIITEVPFMVNKANLVEKIAELANDKRIEGINNIRDESNKSGVRVVIELKKHANADLILNQLYSYTNLQTTFNVMMLALDQGIPKTMTLKDVIVAFVNFREEVVTRRTIFLLNKARDKAHILVGIIIAVSNIDEVIKIIRSSSNSDEAKSRLTARMWNISDVYDLVKLVDDRAVLKEGGQCFLTEQQTKSILELRLQRLTNTEKTKIEEELGSLEKEIKSYLEILGSREKLLEIIKFELNQIKDQFATARLTTIENEEFEHDVEDLIPEEEVVVTVTLAGYIKRVPLATYRAQKRGGKGRIGSSVQNEDIVTHLFIENTHTSILFFSNIGQVYTLKVYKLPLGTPQSKGRPIINMLSIKENETITNIMPMPIEGSNESDKKYIIFATKHGNIRRNDLSDFKHIASNGKIAIRLDEGDRLISVKSCDEDNHVLLATKNGKAIRFPVKDLRVFKSRTSDGVKAIRLAENDEVISMTILKGINYSLEVREKYLNLSVNDRLLIAKNKLLQQNFNLSQYDLTENEVLTMASNEEFILTVSENGYGKFSSAYEYRVTNRGGKGIANMNVSPKTGMVVSVLPACQDNELMLITSSGKIIRCQLNSVRITGRSTSGVILFKTSKDEKVVSIDTIKDTDYSNNGSEDINNDNY
ncbi:DNA gyrase, A subunit [Orientia chuto str. Dubai]|uniref:DNA gyrase subunit A n=1 Tax=Orientia chuto str. Dubai TaxID=1359168 RepID=A0A0F3MI48_9RICK|nr:DNA topoisomerase (ATP-hydrolyzing) subunit A [Candidatus Orientia mediorientalis]KJV55331.1 DNA gyrase, A subunit [Orientia chuto str. Dubai]